MQKNTELQEASIFSRLFKRHPPAARLCADAVPDAPGDTAPEDTEEDTADSVERPGDTAPEDTEEDTADSVERIQEVGAVASVEERMAERIQEVADTVERIQEVAAEEIVDLFYGEAGDPTDGVGSQHHGTLFADHSGKVRKEEESMYNLC